MRDRGQIAFGCSQKQIESEWSTVNPETRPNQFASDLLLPTKRFVPLAKGQLPVLAPCLERTTYCRQAVDVGRSPPRCAASVRIVFGVVRFRNSRDWRLTDRRQAGAH
jgi:hypothetical protein